MPTHPTNNHEIEPPQHGGEVGSEHEPSLREKNSELIQQEAYEMRDADVTNVSEALGLDPESRGAMDATNSYEVDEVLDDLEKLGPSNSETQEDIAKVLIESAGQGSVGGIAPEDTPVAKLVEKNPAVLKTILEVEETLSDKHVMTLWGDDVAEQVDAILSARGVIETVDPHSAGPAMEQAVAELSEHPVMQDRDDQEDSLAAATPLEFIPASSAIDSAQELGRDTPGEHEASMAAAKQAIHIFSEGTAEEKAALLHEIGNDLGKAEEIAEAARGSQLNDWDGVRATVLLEAASNARGWQETSSGFESPFDENPSQERLDNIDAARQISEIAAGISPDAAKAKQLLAEYGDMAASGVNVSQALRFDTFLKKGSIGEQGIAPTVESVLDFTTKFEGMSEEAQDYAEAVYGVNLDRLLTVDLSQYISFDKDDTLNEQRALIGDTLNFLGVELESDEDFHSRIANIQKLSLSGIDFASTRAVFGHPSTLDGFMGANPSDLAIHELSVLAGPLTRDMFSDDGMQADVLRTIQEYPDDIAGVVDHIEARAKDLLEAGVDKDALASIVFIEVSQYRGNGLSTERTAVDRLRCGLDALEIVAPYQDQLKAAFGKSLYVSSTIGVEMGYGADIDKDEIAAKLATLSSELQTLRTESPTLFDALKGSEYSTLGNLDHLNRDIAHISQNQDIITFAAGYYSDSTRNQNEPILNAIESEGHYAANGRRTVVDTIRGAKSIIDDVEGVNARSLIGIALGRHVEGPEDMGRLGDVLRRDEVRAAYRDAEDAKSLDSALATMFAIPGKFDVVRQLDTLHEVQPGERQYLSWLVQAEGAQESQEARDVFNTHAPAVLRRRDKNGNLYDNPMSLGAVVNKSFEGGTADDLGWFMQSEMPVAAYDVVDRYRSSAREAGIGDTPKAVYEWVMGDPNKLVEISGDNLTAYSEKLFRRSAHYDSIELNDEQKAQLVEKSKALAEELRGDFRVMLNIHPDSLIAAGGDGKKLLSTFDRNGERTNHEGSSVYESAYMFHRSGVEVALGIRLLDDTGEHPVYGSCGFIGQEVPGGAIGYGGVMITLKPTEAVMARTTFTPEDSFHGADRLTAEDAMTARILKSAMGAGHARTEDYVEAQISGGVAFDDIETVYVLNDEMLAMLPEELRAKAKIRETSIENEFNPNNRTYKGTREAALLQEVLST